MLICTLCAPYNFITGNLVLELRSNSTRTYAPIFRNEKWALGISVYKYWDVKTVCYFVMAMPTAVVGRTMLHLYHSVIAMTYRI